MVECSPGWAAPEQLRTAPATPAVDVFAWGCVLAYLAGGVHPFASQGDQEWILRVQSAEPDLVRVPPGLHDVIRQSLARDPRERPSARELAAICRARGVAHRRPVPPARPAGPAAVRRHRLPTRLTTRAAPLVAHAEAHAPGPAAAAGLPVDAEHPSTGKAAVTMTAPPARPPGRTAAAGPDGALGQPDAGSPADPGTGPQERGGTRRRHRHPANRYRHDERTSGQRLADAVTAVFGSWRFIIIQTGIVAVWIALNLIAVIYRWDPYPFILLNLVFSTQAAYAAPLIPAQPEPPGRHRPGQSRTRLPGQPTRPAVPHRLAPRHPRRNLPLRPTGRTRRANMLTTLARDL